MAPNLTLYFSVGSCSGASYLALKVAKIPFTAIRADTKTHKIVATGEDYYQINPKGAVPSLFIDGDLLTENAAILPYIADLAPEAKLAPAAGTPLRYKLHEALSEVGVDLHKLGFGALFNPALQGEARDAQVAKLHGYLKRFDTKLSKNKWLLGETLSVADFYAAVCFSWGAFLKISYDDYPNIVRYQKDFDAVPGIAEAKAEWLSGGPKA
ncbi:glutathione S-transferase-like protein [Gonapodya prolifera JEL478]|uniref:Glutathione S-transferase-like protein n=1 Tax=Gonapodya prolifera (strain JEL478) TaxID=1344416 RepID=A0A139APY6_GONPJ|nr:glutathione S-transferase-like protein [Gonapodya prolifera JEL478]|eukprot:KXS18788.1 glutathione S-transferase-like protein [Gonapodya prolifera JEL478]